MTTFAWHVHHETLIEPLTEPIENRIAYIKQAKPASEVELRLRLLKPVQGELPAALDKARAALDKAWAALDKARAALDKAWAAYVKARAAHVKARAAHVKARAALDKAWAALDKAWAALDKARAAHVKARAALDKARAACMPEIEALHAIECPDCPWDGTSIFPKAGAS